MKGSAKRMYLVIMVIYDDGKGDISAPTPTERTVSTMKSHSTCDIYYDVFNTYEKAFRFYNANRQEMIKC